MKKFLLTIMLGTLVAACGGGGDSNPQPPPVALSLDGVYRGSPVIASAGGFTFDYEHSPGNAYLFFDTHGRVYTTTVSLDDTIAGTATLYKSGAVTTAALSGSISATGSLNLNFVDGSSRVNISAQRLRESSIPLIGRAWCTMKFDNVTVDNCFEFDVLNNFQFITPTHGNQNVVTVSLRAEVEPNVYEASLDWALCPASDGLVSFAQSEDRLHDEMAITVVGPCGFIWWVIRATR